jgi:hypothetical protein
MLHDTVRLEAALAPLVGLPLWKSTRVTDLQAFHFGDKRTQTNRAGQESEVGDFALHVQCAWRIRGSAGIVVASGDRYHQPDFAPVDEQWDWSAPGTNRCDERIRAWLQQSYEVKSITADPMGGVALVLADSFVLEIFPDDSLDGEYSEHWRILRPGDLGSHFVVSGSGVED